MNTAPMTQLRLFGSPSLSGDDGAPLRGRAGQRHRIALLALVALAPAQRLSREKVLAYLWPESEPERARNLLNVATYVLRTALGEGALVSAGEELRLDPSVVRTDVAEFESAIGRADHARAVTLYRGPFLDGFFLSDAPEFEHWADRERERLADGYRKSLESLAGEAERTGDAPKAAEWWKLRATQDPYDSRVAFRLMQALEASGNRAGALQHASIHERLLRDEFGVGPTPEIRALTDRLRTPPVVGEHRVRTDAESRGPRETKHPVLPGDAPPTMEPAASDPVAADVVEAPPVAPVAVAGASTRRPGKWMGVAAGLLAMVSVLGVTWAVWPRGSAQERSVAVLPFLDLSPGQSNEYFSDGVTEEIITRLASVPGLKVISRTSAMHYKGSTQSLQQIASELGVDHVLEGSVRQGDGRVRITTQLIETQTDVHLWAESYDYELADILRVQEEIAQEVVRALEVELGEQASRMLVRHGTRDPEAYRLYRRARFLWSTRTRDAHEQALKYYAQAIERDSGYADAYAGMADAYLTAYQTNISGLSGAEVYSRLKWAAERALALDDESADAHTSFAVAQWWQKNWPGAERELRRALELNPGYVTAHTWYALLLSGLGRPQEALRESRRSFELDPFSVTSSSHYAWHSFLDRDYDRALAQYRRTLEISPSWGAAYWGVGMSCAQLGMAEESITALQKAVELSAERTDYVADLAYVQALAGRTDDARANVRLAKTQVWEAFSIARAHVALAEPDSAFAWLERSSWQWPHRAVLSDPTLDPVRSDARFAQLVARVRREMGIR